MISEYLKERAKWSKFGKPLRKQEEMEEIFSICNACPQYKRYSETHGQCAVCGCHIKKTGKFLAKNAWGTTRCPLPEPKWVESDTRYAREVLIEQKDIESAEEEHAEDLEQNIINNTPSQPPCNCK